MPAAEDSPMHKDMYDRILAVAEEDDRRAQDLGRPLPASLTLLLSGGREIVGCHLLDGVNSVDDASIDVAVPVAGKSPLDSVWIVPIAHIVAMLQRYPSQEGDAAAPEPPEEEVRRHLVEALRPFAQVAAAYDYWSPEVMPDFSFPVEGTLLATAREDCPDAVGQLDQADFRRAAALVALHDTALNGGGSTPGDASPRTHRQS
jgi:hypothetical protein